MTRLIWMFFILFLCLGIADIVTTHYALRLVDLTDSKWKLDERNQFLVWIWGRYGYTTGMLLKLMFHILVGVTLAGVTLMIQRGFASSWMAKWMLVFISILCIYYFYTVSSNIQAIKKATDLLNLKGVT